ncbi:MAG: hypothetical protein HC834_04380 [Rhodospirillales bacterium]|nr:hypothetical protein [Rhodospirillales bacterium]
MLLHSSLFARHQAMMIGAQFERAGLAHALGVICHGNSGTTKQLPAADVPNLPQDGGDQGSCPLCMAGAPHSPPILSDGAWTVTRPLDPRSIRVAVLGELILQRIADERPPPRGPPALA